MSKAANGGLGIWLGSLWRVSKNAQLEADTGADAELAGETHISSDLSIPHQEELENFADI